MCPSAITRRDFLASSAGSLAAVAVAARPGLARDETSPLPAGPVYGRVGKRGIPPGTAEAPSRGDVILLDGRVLVASHETRQGIRPGRSVLLAPDGPGRWTILYAQFEG